MSGLLVDCLNNFLIEWLNDWSDGRLHVNQFND